MSGECLRELFGRYVKEGHVGEFPRDFLGGCLDSNAGLQSLRVTLMFVPAWLTHRYTHRQTVSSWAKKNYRRIALDSLLGRGGVMACLPLLNTIHTEPLDSISIVSDCILIHANYTVPPNTGVSIYLCQGESGSRWLPKFNGVFLVQQYICRKIFMRIQWRFPEIWAKLWKMHCLTALRNTSKNSSIRIPMTSKFNQFFLVHRYICGKIFAKMRSVVFMQIC